MSLYKITPLHLGDITRPKANMIYGYEGDEVLDFPLIAYYLEGAHKVLVDTGGSDPESEQGKKAAPYSRTPQQALDVALKAIGVSPEDIDYVILTHLHWDHAANNHLFPNAKLFCQKAEIDGLQDQENVRKGYELDYIMKFDYELIDGDQVLFPGISVMLTPGHTPGMQSIVVDTDMGKVVLTGDLVTLRQSLTYTPPRFNALLYRDAAEKQAQESLNKILKVSINVLPGHDPSVFSENMGLRSLGRRIIQWDPDTSLCAGCGSCEVVCSLIHEGVSGSRSRRIFFEHDSVQLIHRVYSCQQCLDHPCYEACPLKEKAMLIDSETGIVYVGEQACIGCKLCVKACPFEVKRIQMNRAGKAIKCDLCRGRENGPACIEYCQCLAVGMSDDQPPVPGVVVKV